MNRLSACKMLVVMNMVMISVLSGVFFTQVDKQIAFGFEENILPLQTGIISTSNQDFALSQEFEARIFQDGKIMRLSGITTTGEQYYLYQKIVGGDTIVKGKIFVNNAFVPIIFNKEFLEQKTQQVDTELIMVVKLPSYTYANYQFGISVKVFDGEINPKPKYESRVGALENVFVNVTITDRFENHVTTLSGQTDSIGLFQDEYLVLENVVDQGEYEVNVMIDDGNTNTRESFTTFFRGDIRDYFHDTN